MLLNDEGNVILEPLEVTGLAIHLAKYDELIKQALGNDEPSAAIQVLEEWRARNEVTELMFAHVGSLGGKVGNILISLAFEETAQEKEEAQNDTPASDS